MNENVKIHMKTLDDKSFGENVRSEELTPSIDENVKIDMNVRSEELTPL